MIKKIIKKIFFRKNDYEQILKNSGVVIGRNCSIGNCIVSSEPYLITIGDHVQLTDGVRIFTHGGAWVLRDEIPDFDFFGKVCIGNNVYIGNNALIMPGVTIGDNVIIAAGSVVTKTVNSNTVLAGNPAKIICSFDDYRQKYLSKNMHTYGMDYESKKKHVLSSLDDLFLIR